MGTTLTGTTPQDTYDSLIKVTDNGPISGTAKYLSDGLGNDSALAMSTTAVGIGTNVPVGKLTIAGTSAQPPSSGTTPNSLLQIKGSLGNQLNIGSNTAAGDYGAYIQASDTNLAVNYPLNLQPNGGNVGIGISAPTELLHLSTTLASSTGVGTAIQITSAGAGGDQAFIGVNKGVGNGLELSVENRDIIFNTGATTPFGGTERFRITANGVTFNGDTAAANALDDYEEGTFTPSIAFGGASVGITYFDRQGNYTKIGRQVTCTIYMAVTNVGSSTGNAEITGLPFTCANANRGTVGAPSYRFNNITFSGQLTGSVPNNNTIIELTNTTLLGVQTSLTNANFSSASEFNAITITYFTA